MRNLKIMTAVAVIGAIALTASPSFADPVDLTGTSCPNCYVIVPIPAPK